MTTSLSIAVPAALIAGGLITGGLVATGYSATGSGQAPTARSSREVVEIDDARLKFEINATDRDGGVQVFLDADQWKRMSIYDPKGRRIFTTATLRRMAKQGGTELFVESGEPNFKELSLRGLLKRWPAGRYKFRGTGLEGETFVGSARLTHHLPAGPKQVSPVEGDRRQDPAHTVLRWRRVPAPKGSRIIAYQVVVETDTRLRALPTVAVDVMMPPSATRLRVPAGFLKPRTQYDWEVLAIEKSGNQTISEASFTTSR